MSTKPALLASAAAARTRRSSWLALALLGAAALIWLTNLDTPPLWFDEGWTLSVARTWVETGLYGRLLAGEPDTPGLAASFPTVATVAASFRLLGVGAWQGRLPFALLTLANLALVYGLSRALYGRRVALGAVGGLILLTPHLSVSPLYAGRQVLAEPMQIFWLLLGYAALLAALRRRALFLLPATLCWGLALIAKGQTMPFLTSSLLVAGLAALAWRRWRAALLIGAGLAGALACAQLLRLGVGWLLSGRSLPDQQIPGLASVLAFMPQAQGRQRALEVLLVSGLPSLLGVLAAAWAWLRTARAGRAGDDLELARLALLALAGGWLAWYALLSIGWARYLHPAVVVASPFAAALLAELTGGFSLPATLARISEGLRGRRVGAALGSLLALIVIVIYIPLSAWQIAGSYRGDSAATAAAAARFIEERSRPGALVETYESELLFLLDRPVHYPPDIVNLEMIRRGELGDAAPSSYDPLAADPDLLVVGEFGAAAEIYDAHLGAFRELGRVGTYTIYERVRAAP